jgi:uncharacterized protein YhfF
VDDPTSGLRERTGLDVVGCYAFGSGPAHADELLAFVTRGTKRATAGARSELEGLEDPWPAPGQLWGLLDGAGEPRYVAETVDVVTGRLGEVTPAFAWDEGEDDGTLETWLDGHRSWAADLAADAPDPEPDHLEVLFERFRIVWPEPDRTDWLVDGVRPRRYDEAAWVRALARVRNGDVEVAAAEERWDVGHLPGLVVERDGVRLGALAFRPRPGTSTLCFGTFAVEQADDPGEVADALHRGLAALGARHEWAGVQEGPACS